MLEFEYTNNKIDNNLDLYEALLLRIRDLKSDIGNAKSKKLEDELSNTINRAGNVLKTMLAISDKMYNQHLQKQIYKESTSLEEETEKLNTLKRMIKNRESVLKKITDKHKKATEITIIPRIKGLTDLTHYESQIKLIKEYNGRLIKIERLENKRNNADVDLVATNNSISTSHQKNIEDEKVLTDNFNKLLESDSITKIDPTKVEKEYNDARELLDDAFAVIELSKSSKDPLKEKDALKNLDYPQREYNRCYSLFLKLQLLKENRTESVDDVEYEKKLKRIKDILEKLLDIKIADNYGIVYKERLNEIVVNLNKIRLQKIDIEKQKTIIKDIEAINTELEKLRKINESDKVQKVIGPFIKKEEEIETVENKEDIEEIQEPVTLNNMWEEELSKPVEEVVIEDVKEPIVEEPTGFTLTSNVVAPEETEEVKETIEELRQSDADLLESIVTSTDYDNTPGVEEENKANIVNLEEINKLPEASPIDVMPIPAEKTFDKPVEEPKNLEGPMVVGNNDLIGITDEMRENMTVIDPMTIIDKNPATTDLKMELFNHRGKLKVWWSNMLNKLFASKPHTLTKGGN